MKVALIHDHLAQDGGAESVLKTLSEMFPDAPIYTLLYDEKIIEKYYPDKRIEASIIQRLPGGIKHYKWYMPFMPMAVEFFDLRNYDLVISSASAFAKGVITPVDTLHICYCHTPTRYLWSDTHQYINELKYNKYFKKIISLSLNKIRIWDRLAADRVDSYISISKTIKKRIKKYYKRDSTIIHPPVNLNDFYLSDQTEDFFLIGCRLVPYKRVDLAIEAFKKNGLKLKIFGDGIDMPRLKKIAGESSNIEFLGRIDDQSKYRLYSKCQAFIHPQEEDFGITPIESIASGRPVIVYGKGGATETIEDGVTGVFFYKQDIDSLLAAIEKFKTINFNPALIRQKAQKYSLERFKREINDFICRELKKFRGEDLAERIEDEVF